jgi:15-cis-phytoene synthase
MNGDGTSDSVVIARRSKSFALASRLLGAGSRDAAHAVYAWCRRADDAVDEPSSEERATDAVARLFEELDSLYAGAPTPPAIAGFARVVRHYSIPIEYPRELVFGMHMDAVDTHYENWDDLDLYCYRAAGTVGLMMAHVFGVESPGALRHAAHLGMGMQLTNIARDVLEDWQRGRLYLPRRLLGQYGLDSLSPAPGRDLPEASIPGLKRCVHDLVLRSERYYASGAAGFAALAPRNSLGVRAAALIYAEIGRELSKQDYDPTRGRARVSGMSKLRLVAKATAATLVDCMRRRRPFIPATLLPINYPDDVLPF